MKYLVTTILLFFLFQVFGQKQWSRAEVTTDGTTLYGILLSDGSWLVEPNFDQVVLHSTHSTAPKNFFLVERNGKWGIYTHSGKFIIPAIYDDIHLYSNFIHVEKEGKQGAFKFNGMELLPCEYKKVIYASYSEYVNVTPQGRFIVFGEEGYFGAIDTAGKVLVPPNNDYILQRNSFLEATKNFTTRIYNTFGKELPTEGYTEFKGNDYSHSYHDYLRVKKGEKWGLMDMNGTLILQPKYSELYINNDKYISLKDGHKSGIALYSGEIILDPIYADIRRDEYHPLFVFMKDNKRGLCHWNGAQLLPMEYDEIRIKRDYIQLKKGEKYGLSDTLGRIILEAKYDHLQTPYGWRMAFFQQDGKWGAVSWAGREIIPALYDDLYDNRNWIFARKDGKMSGFSLNGKSLFANADNMRKIEDLLFFQQGDKWKAVDVNGTQIIPPNYSDIGHSMSYGPLPVEKNGKWGYINEKNETVIPFIYDKASSFFSNDRAHVTKNGINYQINKQNERIPEEQLRTTQSREDFDIPPPLPASMNYSERRKRQKLSNWSIFQKDDQVGILEDSAVLVAPQYDELIVSEFKIILAKNGNHSSIIDSTGKLVAELSNVQLSPFYPLNQNKTKNHEVVQLSYSPASTQGELIPFSENLFFTWINSNEKREAKIKDRGYYLYEELNQHPIFKGGHSLMQPYIEQEMKFPKKAKKLKQSAVVYARCMIETDGSISSIHIDDPNVASYFAKEARRILTNFPPLIPAKTFKNIAVRTEIIIPIFFDYHKRFEHNE